MTEKKTGAMQTGHADRRAATEKIQSSIFIAKQNVK
jgi:hypothetical protein